MKSLKLSEIKKIFLIAIVTTLIIIVDQFSKYLVSRNLLLNSSVPVIKNIFYITFVKNQGIAFGIFQRGNLFFILFAAVLTGILLIFSKKLITHFYSAAGFSLILAGALGNLIDRVMRGYIIDFLDFRIWPVFNLSDTVLCIGVILLCIQYCVK